MQKAKVLLLVGETGAGKTSLINSMACYLWCVDYFRPERYKLANDQAKTTEIKAYFVHPKKDKYHSPVVLIDIPGFDAASQRSDKSSVQLKEFLKSTRLQLSAILLVISCNYLTRLDVIQNYIVTNLLSFYG